MRLSVALAALPLLLLAACGGAEVIDAGDTTVLVGEKPNGGMDALLGGELSVVGGCLGIDDYVVIWPTGTEVVSEDPLAIDVPDVGEVALGDEIEVGGGEAVEPGRSSAGIEVGGLTVPEKCGSAGIWLANG